jgi:probable phosphoglycerate mutase
VATTIVLVRHGETDWNRERRFQGHADTPLNDVGRAGARALAAELATEPVSALYSSPLQRAFETARIVGEPLGIDVVVEERLREIDVGSWQGLTRDEIEARFPDGYRRWLVGEGGWDDGETSDDLARRVLAALADIAAKHDGLVVAVTHGGPIRAALSGAGIRAEGPSIGNCTTVRLAVREGKLERVD